MPHALPARLREWLQQRSAFAAPEGAEARAFVLRALIADGLDRLPPPGAGETLARWRALATVAGHDLALLKLYEGHTDALAILAEAGADALSPPGAAWGCWAAEAPGARVLVTQSEGDGRCRLEGVKAWCSGAEHLDRGLLTAWMPDGRGPFLAAVDLCQSGVSFDAGGWAAVGMAASDSVDVRFAAVSAQRVGGAGFYLERPGFWQGGAGIAACWHGASTAVAQRMRADAAAREDAGWHRLLALGDVDRVLGANAALLREAAAWIDGHPRDDARAWALRTRCAAEAAADHVLRSSARALGATPLCRDARHARLAADLPVFIRQSHGDRDLAALGEAVAAAQEAPWTL